MENVMRDSTGGTQGSGSGGENGGWVEVRPEMLEGELEDELRKFEKFGEGVRETEVEQDSILSELEVCYHLWL